MGLPLAGMRWTCLYCAELTLSLLPTASFDLTDLYILNSAGIVIAQVFSNFRSNHLELPILVGQEVSFESEVAFYGTLSYAFFGHKKVFHY